MGLAMIDARKQRISDAFGAAARQYDDHAGPQRRAADRIAELAAGFGPVRRILEIGCGTGLLTQRLVRQWPGAEIIATDISPAMVSAAKARIGDAAQFRVMDGEWPSLQEAGFDLILSSLTFQWFMDLPGAVTRSIALLRPGGRLMFSTMGKGSLNAWLAAHVACGVNSGVADYLGKAALHDLLSREGDAQVAEERFALEARGALALLRHLRGIGAIVPSGVRRPLPAGTLRRVMAHYDRAGGTDDYVVLYAQVAKPIA